MNDFYCHIQCEQLDAKCEKLEATNAELCEEVQKLETLNAELLGALENVYYPILSWLGEFDSESGLLSHPALQKARAAIAKAKGESHED